MRYPESGGQGKTNKFRPPSRMMRVVHFAPVERRELRRIWHYRTSPTDDQYFFLNTLSALKRHAAGDDSATEYLGQLRLQAFPLRHLSVIAASVVAAYDWTHAGYHWAKPADRIDFDGQSLARALDMGASTPSRRRDVRHLAVGIAILEGSHLRGFPVGAQYCRRILEDCLWLTAPPEMVRQCLRIVEEEQLDGMHKRSPRYPDLTSTLERCERYLSR